MVDIFSKIPASSEIKEAVTDNCLPTHWPGYVLLCNNLVHLFDTITPSVQEAELIFKQVSQFKKKRKIKPVQGRLLLSKTRPPSAS